MKSCAFPIISRSTAVLLALTCTLLVIITPQHAKANAIIDGARECLRHQPQFERFHEIPTHWLTAISMIESGRYHNGLEMALPWPWTINVKGKGYWFDTKAEAIAAVKKHQKRGTKSIDVGCMQINLKYHPDAFLNLEQAFDPGYNVGYAAKFLRKNFDNTRSWREATARYHSHTPKRGKAYYRKVYKRWEQAVDRIQIGWLNSRYGKFQQAKLEATYPKEGEDAEKAPTKTQRSYKAVKLNDVRIGQQNSRVIRPRQASQTQARLVTANYSPQAQTVSALSSQATAPRVDRRRENGVMVIRPQPIPKKEQPVKAVVQATNTTPSDKEASASEMLPKPIAAHPNAITPLSTSTSAMRSRFIEVGNVITKHSNGGHAPPRFIFP